MNKPHQWRYPDPTYDDDGNMTLAPLSSFGGPLLASTLGWNGENRMISASNTAMVASYNYDYMGRRFQKTVVTNSVTNTITFIYDGWLLVGEQSVIAGGDGGNLTNVTRYVWGLDLSGSMQGAGGIGGLLSMSRDTGTATNTYLYCFDGNGNVVNLIDASDGSVAATYEYSPFGSLVRPTGTMANDNPARWSTKHTDDETGLVVYEYRAYSPQLGRFIQRDPIEENGGFNIYAALGNNPISRWDKLGLLLCDVEEVFTSRADAGRRMRRRVNPTVQGITDVVIRPIVTISDCPKGEAGESWGFFCKITIYYFIPAGDVRLPDLRRHENYHRDVGDALYLKHILNAMSGECLCLPCFNATKAYHEAVARRYVKEADKANTWWDCNEGNWIACTRIASLDQQILQMLQDEVRKMQAVQKACQ